jgi:O-methyltransferase involved in polyketide biosynthesis
MDPVRASMTALGAAYRRTYHDAYDIPKVFEDRFAALLVSPDEATAIEGTFMFIKRIVPRGSEIVFDYLTAMAFVPERQSPALKLRFDRARAVGEPYTTGFEPSELSNFLRPLGYALIEDLSQFQQTERFFRNRTDGICPVEYWHWAHARVV